MKNLFPTAVFMLLLPAALFGRQLTTSSLGLNAGGIKPSEYTPSPNCPKMPARIVEYLEKISGTIPQTEPGKNAHNAFQIQFGKRGQNDWAVLCSRNGYSSILIFRNSPTANVSEFAARPDTDFVRARGYLRAIGKTTAKPANAVNLKNYGDILKKIDTWGIDEQTADGKRVIYYVYRRQSIVLRDEEPTRMLSYLKPGTN